MMTTTWQRNGNDITVTTTRNGPKETVADWRDRHIQDIIDEMAINPPN